MLNFHNNNNNNNLARITRFMIQPHNCFVFIKVNKFGRGELSSYCVSLYMAL